MAPGFNLGLNYNFTVPEKRLLRRCTLIRIKEFSCVHVIMEIGNFARFECRKPTFRALTDHDN